MRTPILVGAVGSSPRNPTITPTMMRMLASGFVRKRAME
jgi:hypothetical protein